MSKEQICWLQIPMDEFLLEYLLISNKKLVHVVKDLCLRKSFLDFPTQITFTQLSDDVSIVLCGVDFVQGEYMWHILHGFEDLDFGGQQSSINLALEHFEIDNFDCHRLVIVVVSTLINAARVSLSDRIIQSIGEILYFLTGI